MKYILVILTAGLLCSCSYFDKSEEAVFLKIDTASLLKGRNIHADIDVNSDNNAEGIHHKK